MEQTIEYSFLKKLTLWDAYDILLRQNAWYETQAILQQNKLKEVSPPKKINICYGCNIQMVKISKLLWLFSI